MTEKETVADFMERIGVETYDLIADDFYGWTHVELYLSELGTWVMGDGNTLESALTNLGEALG
jgi:hypothetical protein